MSRSANTDPLEKFRFLVEVSFPGMVTTPQVADQETPTATGATFATLGFHDIQMPKRSTNKIMYREGHNPDINSVSAGLSSMEDVVMSRGVVTGSATAVNDFYKWVSRIYVPTTGIGSFTTNPGTSSGAQGFLDYRGEVIIKMLDRAGQVARAWRLYQAWPTNFVPGSDLNAAEDGDKSMEALTLAYEDFQEVNLVDLTTSVVVPPAGT